MCCIKQTSVINLIYSGQQLFSYTFHQLAIYQLAIYQLTIFIHLQFSKMPLHELAISSICLHLTYAHTHHRKQFCMT
jgi:hypothetical protein